jgi:hypothetical protein
MTQHDGLHEPSGPPDMRLGSLAIWVCGRQFSDSQDYCDANLPTSIAGGQNVLERFPIVGSRNGSAGLR